MSDATLSVIIPALNEAGTIEPTLGRVLSGDVHEVIVADGGSSDETAAIAERCGARVISGATGRGPQLNAGAAVATGNLLFFLHADTLPPEGFADHIRATLAEPGVSGGAFGFRLDSATRAHRLVDWTTNRRARLFGLPYGDQGLFTTAEMFHAVGGFPDEPVMEDVQFVRRLKRRGRIAFAPADMSVSSRRWDRRGVVRVTTEHQFYLLAWKLGVSPDRIAQWRERGLSRSD